MTAPRGSRRAQALEALQRAAAAHQAGRLDEAEALYNRVLAADARQFDALNMLGILHGQRRNYAAAVRLIERALEVDPRSPEALANLGRLHAERGDLPGAASRYAQALAIKPDFALAHSNYAAILRRLGRPADALTHCDRALALHPAYGEALNQRGHALIDLRRCDEALASYDRAAALAPQSPAAWLGRGNALAALGRHHEALAGYDRALALDPDLAAAWCGRGHVLAALWQYPAAGAAYDQALARDPTAIAAWIGRGTVLEAFRRFAEAFAAWDRAFAIDPAAAFVEGFRFYTKLNIGDWTGYESERSRLVAGVRQGKPVAVPLAVLAASSSAADQLAAARICTADLPAAPTPPARRSGAGDRINLVYLSADFRDHPVAYLMAGLFERHDRSRFNTIAVAFGPDDAGAMRTRIRTAFAHFIDANQKSDLEVAALLRDLGADIAVDLMGFTQGYRLGILAQRPAPVQVNYLGYPGTIGAACMDYILADRYVIPEAQRAHYSEKIVDLPDTFQVNTRRVIAERTPSRADCGLPPDGFVFCAFNATYKITPPLFDIWMRLLAQVPGSVLWLVSHRSGVEERWRQEAARRGIAAERLVFAPRIPYPDHLARFRCADLFLDTLPFNGGTTVSDALWAGLPVVSCAGEAFAARMAGSLLRAAGLAELATESLADYAALAQRLATDPAQLAAVRARLAAGRDTGVLFDTDRFRRHIESAYIMMHERHCAGHPPESFAVPAIDA